MDRFLTTTKQDYTCKSQPKRCANGVMMEFQDPLKESFRNYLQLSSKLGTMSTPEQNFDEYLTEVEKRHSKLVKMHFEHPLNNATMTRCFIDDGKSVYQVDYCDLEKDEAYKEMMRQKNMFRLPNDYNVPLTTQKYCFRSPKAINSRAYEKTKITRIPNNLDKNERLRDILKVTTGVTEYGGVIGKLGDIVINEKLHAIPDCIPK